MVSLSDDLFLCYTALQDDRDHIMRVVASSDHQERRYTTNLTSGGREGEEWREGILAGVCGGSE